MRIFGFGITVERIWRLIASDFPDYSTMEVFNANFYLTTVQRAGAGSTMRFYTCKL